MIGYYQSYTKFKPKSILFMQFRTIYYIKKLLELITVGFTEFLKLND